jgi:hypothetical protein
VKPEHSAGPVVNQLRDFVAVTGPLLNGSKDHEFCAAALHVCVWRHMWWDAKALQRRVQERERDTGARGVFHGLDRSDQNLQGTWNYTMSNRVLLEVGSAFHTAELVGERQPGVLI